MLVLNTYMWIITLLVTKWLTRTSSRWLTKTSSSNLYQVEYHSKWLTKTLSSNLFEKCCFLGILSTVMWLLKSPLNFRLSLLTFNLLVILKATSLLRENTKRILQKCLHLPIYFYTRYWRMSLPRASLPNLFGSYVPSSMWLHLLLSLERAVRNNVTSWNSNTPTKKKFKFKYIMDNSNSNTQD
jgi:hypothetical protein